MISFTHWLLREDASLQQQACSDVENYPAIAKAGAGNDHDAIQVTQLQALLNTVRMARPSDLYDYVGSRAERRRKANKTDQAEFWDDLVRCLRKIEKDTVAPALDARGITGDAEKGQYTSRVFEAYIQHFVSHCLYLKKIS